MASMYKGALWPLYWLSLRRDAIVTPVPCYSAMRVLMSRWKKGRLPRKAWGDGWWELLDGKRGLWKRVNLKERPTWSEYTKASEEIKVKSPGLLLSLPKSMLIASRITDNTGSRRRIVGLLQVPRDQRLFPGATSAAASRND